MSVIYPALGPVPPARVQLIVDQAAKAPFPAIAEDVLAIVKAKAQSEQKSSVDFKA